eukprot:1183544-Prorocentrum_minimum.AAC.5
MRNLCVGKRTFVEAFEDFSKRLDVHLNRHFFAVNLVGTVSAEGIVTLDVSMMLTLQVYFEYSISIRPTVRPLPYKRNRRKVPRFRAPLFSPPPDPLPEARRERRGGGSIGISEAMPRPPTPRTQPTGGPEAATTPKLKQKFSVFTPVKIDSHSAVDRNFPSRGYERLALAPASF